MHCPSLPVTAHDWHVPAHAVAQQTPCSQCPEAQSAAAAQAAPGGFGPQLPFTQAAPATQSASPAQVARQFPAAAHRYLPQESEAAGAQIPSPSQRAAWVTVDPVHACGAQIAPAA
jgi:hypothetical protein